MRDFRDLVIFDPVAAGAERDKVREIIAHTLPAASFRGLVEGEAIKPDIERAVISGYERIIVAGGDELIADVAAGMLYTGLPLGILPLGPDRATAAGLNLPSDPAEACALLALGGKVRELDALHVNGHLALTPVVLGRLASPDKAEIRARLGFGRAWRLRIVADATVHKLKAACLVVGRATNARVRDGRLHVSFYPKRSVFRALGRRAEAEVPVALLQAVREIRVECGTAISVRINSEVLRTKAVRIENLPGALRVVTPYSPPAAPPDRPF